MRKLLKKGISSFLVPAVRWYLRKERKHLYRGVEVRVYPGVFHPGLFSSTHFLIDYLAARDLLRKTLLELGSGTGLISIWAAAKGANATAVDLSSRAVENTWRNVNAAGFPVRVLRSDLFDSLNDEVFDWILINPPYYSRPIQSEADLAWNCGERLEYFQKLFKALGNHMHADSEVVMILTQEGCDLAGIFRLAEQNFFYLEMMKERKAWLDGKDYLFRIRPARAVKATDQV